MEREKVREADTIRFLYLVRFFFQFYLLLRAQEVAAGIDPASEQGHDFDLIANMTDPACMAFVSMRMKAALDEKPVLWTELHAGVDCLIQLVRPALCESLAQSLPVPTISSWSSTSY